jgi:hypothetical protein
MMKESAVVFTAAGLLTLAYVASGPPKLTKLATAPQASAAPQPFAGQRIRAYQDRCATQVTGGVNLRISAQEMARRNLGRITPYQMDRETASYEQAIKRCMEGALYDDPEAAQVLARSRAAVGDR